MKKLPTLAIIALTMITLAACSNDSHQAKDNSSLKAENSSLKAKKKEAENSSLKDENESLKNNKGNQVINNSGNNQEAPANMSNEEVAARFKSLKGITSDDYHASVISNGNDTYTVDLGKDTPDGQRVEHIGKYLYNAKTGAIETEFESGEE